MLTYTDQYERAIGDRLGDDAVRVARQLDERGDVYVLVPASDPRQVAVGPCRNSIALAHAIWWDGQTRDTCYYVRPATVAELRAA